MLVTTGIVAAVLLVAGWFVLVQYKQSNAGSAPGSATDSAPGSATSPGAPGLPAIYPVPQHASAASGKPVPLNGHVYVVAAAGTDQASVSAVQALVVGAGGTAETVTSLSNPMSGSSAVYLGAASDPQVSAVLATLGRDSTAANQDALGHPEGYAIATGTSAGIPTAVLVGRDGDGIFHAVQTLRQLLKDGTVPAALISDWPLMQTRGVIEGFYGIPWSHQARLDVIKFAAQQKMNTFIYSPKNDPLLRDQWRTLYSNQQLRELQELIDTATANHIRFAYSLSPGLDICYSSVADLNAAVAKLESLYSLGVRSFVIPLDDIDTKVQCDEDVKEFGSTEAGLGKAEASFLNDVNARFISKKPDIQPLQMVPTFYNGSGSTPYKKALGRALNPEIVVQWTGEDVVSHRITRGSAETAQQSYGSPGTKRNIVIWDNYPVNDYSQDHIFLAPVKGRDSDLNEAIRGIVTNPMIEAYLSLPAIFNYADLSWNGPAYDPAKSMDAALTAVAGPAPDVQAGVRAFADLNQDWQGDALTPSAPALTADINQFWSAYDAGRSPSGALLARAELLQRLPELLPQMAEPGFANDAVNWTAAAAQYGRGVQEAIAMLDAAKKGDVQAVTQARKEVQSAETAAAAATQPTLDLGVVTPVLGKGELKAFLDQALQKVPAG
ncbi:beta-N-acetylglucosaminidase domain-containing protein [Arthrobacter sp. efr-133-TYG-104]|uniref:beta-N-acetylhexosaminidase family protein n=1 Tax=Arthrobacter sp. efr-133-TYG-104 TaxID=3040324 RepID=UPI00254C4A41|nr:beta-N-acetylglucosaminidase domain-containing protein [Arthrobacter sp. efr-133-TYG-104]